MSTCGHTAELTFRSATKSGQNQTGPNCVEVAPFRKATKSNGNGGNNCVEVGYAKATASNPSGNCVEVGHAAASASAAAGHCVEPGLATANHDTTCTPETCTTPGINPGDVVVRDSKLGDASPLIVFTGEQWALFTARVITGEQELVDGDYLIRDPRPTGIILRFTAGEWDAFQDGCRKAEFVFGAAGELADAV